MLYCPGRAEGRMYHPELCCFYFYVAVGQVAVRLELPLYPNQVVVGLPHCPDHAVVGRPRCASEV